MEGTPKGPSLHAGLQWPRPAGHAECGLRVHRVEDSRVRKPPVHPVVSRGEARESRPTSCVPVAAGSACPPRPSEGRQGRGRGRSSEGASARLIRKEAARVLAGAHRVRPSVAASRHPGLLLAAPAPAAPHPNISTLGSLFLPGGGGGAR